MEPLRCHLLIAEPGTDREAMASTLAAISGLPLLTDDSALADTIAAGQPVMLLGDTYSRRSSRLGLTQARPLAAPIDWIGWWVQPSSIAQWKATWGHAPATDEGFVALVALDLQKGGDPARLLQLKWKSLERLVANTRNGNASKGKPHGYSRLLDLERLLYLMQALSKDPGLCSSGQSDGDLVQRAAGHLGRLRGACYADTAALTDDLLWLRSQGFIDAAPVTRPIEPPPPTAATLAHRGGWPAEADRDVFCRRLGLLRHILQHPFDHRPGLTVLDGLLKHDHLAYANQRDTLRKDIQDLLTPYGFRDGSDASRHGHGIGTAVLSATRLREVAHLVDEVARRLDDPSTHDLHAELQQRLRWARMDASDALPVRRFANRSIIHPELVHPQSLCLPGEAERLEAAISGGARVQLHRLPQAASHRPGHLSPDGDMVWPLQLVFHNIGWYLAYESDSVGRSIGLISTERLDRLRLSKVVMSHSRSVQRQQQRQRRLANLLRRSGGIYLGETADLATQDLISVEAFSAVQPHLITVRARCTTAVFRFLREGLQRYPLEQMRFSAPDPLEGWRPPAPAIDRFCLPRTDSDTHPCIIELDLPPWTVARDRDLRRWLFGFGAGLLVEAPQVLAADQRVQALEVLQALQQG